MKGNEDHAGNPRLRLPPRQVQSRRTRHPSPAIEQSRHIPQYKQWLESFIHDCQVLDVSNQTTHHYAAIGIKLRQAGTPIPTNDLWIAALCRQHHLPVLSRDRHFDAVVGLTRVSW
jgi:tRNA(fMet)-specific endonuclease VapC